VDWIRLAQDRNQWRALLNTVVKVRVPQKAENFFTSWAIIGFSRSTRLHGATLVRLIDTFHILTLLPLCMPPSQWRVFVRLSTSTNSLQASRSVVITLALSDVCVCVASFDHHNRVCVAPNNYISVSCFHILSGNLYCMNSVKFSWHSLNTSTKSEYTFHVL